VQRVRGGEQRAESHWLYTHDPSLGSDQLWTARHHWCVLNCLLHDRPTMAAADRADHTLAPWVSAMMLTLTCAKVVTLQ